ncbi:unnamed protein product [Ectocarpus sp. 12 AP-2014]
MKVTEDDLAKYFGLLGEVNNVIMLRDKFTSRHKDGGDAMRGRALPRHKGFAYVEMKSLESVPVVLQLNERVPDFQKFPVMVKASEAEKNYLAKQAKKAKNPTGHVILGNAAALAGLKLHIGNLHQNITEDDLGEICRSFGEVTQLILHRDEAGESKRFAFVTYADTESTNACLEKLDGLEVAGKALAVSYCKADPKTIPKNLDANATATAAAAAAATAHAASLATSTTAGQQSSTAASSNWKLDDDEGAGGVKMDSTNRANIMSRFGGGTGLPPASLGAASATAAAAAAAASTAAMNMGLAGIPGMMSHATLPGMSGTGMGGAMSTGMTGVAAQWPSAAANAALEAALSGTAFGAGAAGAMGLQQQVAAGQGTGQGPLHPAIAAGLPGVGAGAMLPGMGAGVPGVAAVPAAAVPAAAAAAPAAAAPPVVGTPTFCLLVKNMFDPATETDEGWELDIKEEMEEECSKHGAVMHSYVESRQPGGLVYVMFSTTGAAVASAEMLNGRWFAGRMVLVEYLNPKVYTAKFPEATKAAETAMATAMNA